MKISIREKQVLQLIVEEHTTDEIAKILCLSSETIHSHRKNIRHKLEAKNTAGMIWKAIHHGLIPIAVSLCLMVMMTSSMAAQTRNMHIEGLGDQYVVLQSNFDGGSTKTGIELWRGNATTGTDWRMVNDGGLIFERGSNNFETDGDINMRISKLGIVYMYNGTEAEANNKFSGTLVLGDPDDYHIALDDNGIIARQGNIGSRLLIQTGLDKGDTYLNNLSGNVGIGTITPGAKMGVAAEGWQMHFENSDDLTNDWYIGASRDGWSVGQDKFVISPTTSSSDAMLTLNKEDNAISARSNRVISVADPIANRDAVNLRTLKSYCSIDEMSTIESGQTFRECMTRCRTLTEGGHDDWKAPSIDDAAQFVRVIASDNLIWTTDFAGFVESGPATGLTMYYAINLRTGVVDDRTYTSTLPCRCVR